MDKCGSCAKRQALPLGSIRLTEPVLLMDIKNNTPLYLSKLYFASKHLAQQQQIGYNKSKYLEQQER